MRSTSLAGRLVLALFRRTPAFDPSCDCGAAVAAELRRLASWFPAVGDPEDEVQIAYETGKYAVTSVLLRRAAELDPQGGQP